MYTYLRFCSLFVALLLTTSLGAINVTITHAVFAQDGKPFVEINLHIDGRSLTATPITDSTFQTSVAALVLFKQGDEIVQFDKFQVNSPIGTEPVAMIDIKRYALPAGTYQLEIEMADANQAANAGTYRA